MNYLNQQKFKKLKKKIGPKEKYIDRDFLPVNKSLYYTKIDMKVKWCRPMVT